MSDVNIHVLISVAVFDDAGNPLRGICPVCKKRVILCSMQHEMIKRISSHPMPGNPAIECEGAREEPESICAVPSTRKREQTFQPTHILLHTNQRIKVSGQKGTVTVQMSLDCKSLLALEAAADLSRIKLKLFTDKPAQWFDIVPLEESGRPR